MQISVSIAKIFILGALGAIRGLRNALDLVGKHVAVDFKSLITTWILLHLAGRVSFWSNASGESLARLRGS